MREIDLGELRKRGIEVDKQIYTPRPDLQYQSLLLTLLEMGEESPDRTGTGVLKIAGWQLRFDLQEEFPILNTKSVWFYGAKEETLWIKSGETNIKRLADKKVGIWDEWPYQNYLRVKKLEKKFPKYSEVWKKEKEVFIEKIRTNKRFAKKWGELGPVYGYLWRHYPTSEGGEIDQLREAINLVKTDPNSRRIYVDTWDPELTKKMLLPPCHKGYQFIVTNGELNTRVEMRSVDTFLGLPFNIVQYGLLTHMVAQVTNLKPGKLIMQLGDVHLYKNHTDQAWDQLSRDVQPSKARLILDPTVTDIDDFDSEHIQLEKGTYKPLPKIEAPISV